MTERRTRIGILGHVGTQNLGDEAIIAAVLEKVRHRYPGADVIGFTGNPEDTYARHGIITFPIRRSKRRPGASQQTGGSDVKATLGRFKRALKKVRSLHAVAKKITKWCGIGWTFFAELGFLIQCHRRLRGIDLLIVAGSNQLNDYCDGPWAFPFTLLKWSALARIRGAKVAFLCCGAGPLDSRLGTLLIKWSLRLADRRSYRDETSRKLLKELGISVDGPLCTDLAYTLNCGRKLTDQQSRDDRRLVVGINPLPFFDCRYWPEHNANTYQHYVQTLATFATWLGGRGHKVLLFPTQLRADTLVIQDLKFQMRQRAPIDMGNWLTTTDIRSLEELLSTISLMDIAISTRYHGILLPGLLGKPVIAISYGPKSDELMERIGQGQFVLDINTLTVDSLIDKFLLLEAESDTMRTIRRKEIHLKVSGLQRRLDAEYDRVFEILDYQTPAIAADQVLKPF